MDKNITLDPGHYRDLLESLWNKYSQPHSGDSVNCGIGTTLKRRDPHSGDEDEVDIYIEYEAILSSVGYSGSWDEPGSGDEWEFNIIDIKLDLGDHHGPSDLAAVGGPLTPAEKEKITQWFDNNHARASEIANDKYDPSSFYPEDRE